MAVGRFGDDLGVGHGVDQRAQRLAPARRPPGIGLVQQLAIDAIGQRLKRLSGRVQVLSVTHAPQVAARAATHFLISKGPAGDAGDKIATRVAIMEPDHRKEEIARMLAGASITDEARAAAAKLLAGEA